MSPPQGSAHDDAHQSSPIYSRRSLALPVLAAAPEQVDQASPASARVGRPAAPALAQTHATDSSESQ
jgi:hypothetical protein